MAAITISSTIISSASFLYRLWKDGVFFKLANYFKNRKPDFKTDYWAVAERQQRQAFSLAYKIQRYFLLKRGATFISWQNWFALTCGLKYAVEQARGLDEGHIHYLNQKIPTPSHGGGMDGLLDSIGYLMTTFPEEGKEVNHNELELIMRNFMFCLRPEVTRYHKHELDEIKNALRPFQMIMLEAK
jgi:hypothetical protein